MSLPATELKTLPTSLLSAYKPLKVLGSPNAVEGHVYLVLPLRLFPDALPTPPGAIKVMKKLEKVKPQLLALRNAQAEVINNPDHALNALMVQPYHFECNHADQLVWYGMNLIQGYTLSEFDKSGLMGEFPASLICHIFLELFNAQIALRNTASLQLFHADTQDTANIILAPSASHFRFIGLPNVVLVDVDELSSPGSATESWRENVVCRQVLGLLQTIIKQIPEDERVNHFALDPNGHLQEFYEFVLAVKVHPKMGDIGAPNEVFSLNGLLGRFGAMAVIIRWTGDVDNWNVRLRAKLLEGVIGEEEMSRSVG
jgi:hypothetical protein